MNIFLTGAIKVGKSTIINRLLEELNIATGGFRTLRYYLEGKHEGFIMEDLLGTVNRLDKPLFIARPGSRGHWEPVIDTFEVSGVQILRQSLVSPVELIIMDELGHFESQAPAFQKQVMDCLSSPIPVLGVIKLRKTSFLDRVRDRDDVQIVTVTRDNREEQFLYMRKKLREILSCRLSIKANRC